MKIRIWITLLLSVLLLLGLAGCGNSRAGRQLDRAEDAVESYGDRVEDAIENAVQPTTQPAATSAPAQNTGTAEPQSTAAALTKEEAEVIALEHAGFAADQVQYLHTEYEIDDGRPQYEVSFHQDRWEYDYEIDAETGKILSFEKDD